jgi:adenylosuccinate lyase
LAFARELVEGLRVDADRMRANLDAQHGYVLAEPAMLALAARIGKHRAHERVHRAALAGVEAGVTLEEALAGDAEIAAALPREELAALLAPERALGAAGATVDAVLERGRAVR